MKILIICDRNYPYFKGGAEKRSWDISKILTKNNYQIKYISGKWPAMKENKEKIEGIEIKGIYKVKNFYKNGKKSIYESIIFSLKLLPNILKEDFDLIDTDQFPVMHIIPLKIISLIKRKPLIVTWHEVWGKKYWQTYLGKLGGTVGYLIEKISSKLPDKIISVSNLTTERLIKDLKVRKDKVITIPNGVDTIALSKIKESKEKSDIIFAGRLISHKNVDLLIKSISIIKKSNPKIKCIICGDGPEMSSLRKLSDSLKLKDNIKFKGFLKSESELYSLIKSSKVLALPSEREGFGIVVIEANALAVPVVTIDAKDNAAKFLIKTAKNGFIAKKDENSFSTSLKKALSSHKSMKQHCIKESKEYDIKRVTKLIEKIYQDEVSKR